MATASGALPGLVDILDELYPGYKKRTTEDLNKKRPDLGGQKTGKVPTESSFNWTYEGLTTDNPYLTDELIEKTKSKPSDHFLPSDPNSRYETWEDWENQTPLPWDTSPTLTEQYSDEDVTEQYDDSAWLFEEDKETFTDYDAAWDYEKSKAQSAHDKIAREQTELWNVLQYGIDNPGITGGLTEEGKADYDFLKKYRVQEGGDPFVKGYGKDQWMQEQGFDIAQGDQSELKDQYFGDLQGTWTKEDLDLIDQKFIKPGTEPNDLIHKSLTIYGEAFRSGQDTEKSIQTLKRESERLREQSETPDWMRTETKPTGTGGGNYNYPNSLYESDNPSGILKGVGGYLLEQLLINKSDTGTDETLIASADPNLKGLLSDTDTDAARAAKQRGVIDENLDFGIARDWETSDNFPSLRDTSTNTESLFIDPANLPAHLEMLDKTIADNTYTTGDKIKDFFGGLDARNALKPGNYGDVAEVINEGANKVWDFLESPAQGSSKIKEVQDWLWNDTPIGTAKDRLLDEPLSTALGWVGKEHQAPAGRKFIDYLLGDTTTEFSQQEIDDTFRGMSTADGVVNTSGGVGKEVYGGEDISQLSYTPDPEGKGPGTVTSKIGYQFQKDVDEAKNKYDDNWWQSLNKLSRSIIQPLQGQYATDVSDHLPLVGSPAIQLSKILGGAHDSKQEITGSFDLLNPQMQKAVKDQYNTRQQQLAHPVTPPKPNIVGDYRYVGKGQQKYGKNLLGISSDLISPSTGGGSSAMQIQQRKFGFGHK